MKPKFNYYYRKIYKKVKIFFNKKNPLEKKTSQEEYIE